MHNSSDPSQRYGKIMVLGAWILILLLFAFFFWQWDKKANAPQDPQIIKNQNEEETVLIRNRDHQYAAKGQINETEVIFLLDTGATGIVVPLRLAKALNLPKGPKTIAMTAGGKVEVYTTQIEEIRLGHIVLHHLSATINPHMQEDEVLLGMSALKRINFWQEDDKLILKAKGSKR